MLAAAGFRPAPGPALRPVRGPVLLTASRGVTPGATPALAAIRPAVLATYSLKRPPWAWRTRPGSVPCRTAWRPGTKRCIGGWSTGRRPSAPCWATSAASSAVALLCRAGVDRSLLPAVADASPAQQGRRMPATDIPVIAPAEVAAARPDAVVLFLSNLLPEMRVMLPEVEAAGARGLTRRR
jgi:C-methyltransferase C-terminal domain